MHGSVFREQRTYKKKTSVLMEAQLERDFVGQGADLKDKSQ